MPISSPNPLVCPCFALHCSAKDDAPAKSRGSEEPVKAAPERRVRRRSPEIELVERDPRAEARARGKTKTVAPAVQMKTGGAYIPPARLRAMQAAVTDKTSPEYQRASSPMWHLPPRVPVPCCPQSVIVACLGLGLPRPMFTHL